MNVHSMKRSPHAKQGRIRRMRGDASRLQAAPTPANVRDDAASDDASGTAVALAAPSDATGTVREACAEVARKRKNRKQPRIPSEKTLRKASETGTPVSPAMEELPDHAGLFVDEVHRHADLVEVQKGLLNSADEKIRQRTLERLLEMKYGKGAAAAEEPRQIVIDVPRPYQMPSDEMEER
jgi:hypothetical protein